VSAAFATASAPSTPARTRSQEHTTGTVSSLVADATRGPGNAGTLDGIAAAEEDRTLRARETGETGLSDPSESVGDRLAAALGAALGESFAIRDDEEDALSFAQTTFVPAFRSAAEELRAAAARSATARDALVAHGTASAPATPMAHRPAVAAAMAAAEAAAAEGDERGGERARRVMRRLAAE
jgi:hypothetical protein